MRRKQWGASVGARRREGDVRTKRHKSDSRDGLHIVQIESIQQIQATRYPDVVWMGEGDTKYKPHERVMAHLKVGDRAHYSPR